MKEEAKEHRHRFALTWRMAGCGYEPDIVGAIAYRYGLPSIKPHAELGW
jgi:hypothetical protein